MGIGCCAAFVLHPKGLSPAPTSPGLSLLGTADHLECSPWQQPALAGEPGTGPASPQTSPPGEGGPLSSGLVPPPPVSSAARSGKAPSRLPAAEELCQEQACCAFAPASAEPLVAWERGSVVLHFTEEEGGATAGIC